MSRFRLIVTLWLCAVTGLLPNTAQAVEVVWLALSGLGGPYDEVVEAIRADVRRSDAQVDLVVRLWQDLPRLAGPPPRLVVTIGVAALRGLVESDSKLPLLATLVPRTAYAKLAATRRGGLPHSAVWLDQPAGRQFDLLSLAVPTRKRVAVVFGPESRIHADDIQHAAAGRKFAIAAASSEGSEQLWTAMQPAIDNADVLLALPDPQIYNNATLHTVLTSAYGRSVPVMAFSPAFTRAGALLALYSTPTQLGTQVGEIVRATLAGRPLPPPQAPRDFSIDVNPTVARSLGIQIDQAATEKWGEEIRVRERGRS